MACTIGSRCSLVLFSITLRRCIAHWNPKCLPDGLANPLSIAKRNALPKDERLLVLGHRIFLSISVIDLNIEKCELTVANKIFASSTFRKSIEGSTVWSALFIRRFADFYQTIRFSKNARLVVRNKYRTPQLIKQLLSDSKWNLSR